MLQTVSIRSTIARGDVIVCSSTFPSSPSFGNKRKFPNASKKQIANVAVPGFGGMAGQAPRAPPDLSLATLPQLRVMDRRGAAHLYEAGLEFSRRQDWQAARRVFKTTTDLYPDLCRAWVSWAQVRAEHFHM